MVVLRLILSVGLICTIQCNVVEPSCGRQQGPPVAATGPLLAGPPGKRGKPGWKGEDGAPGRRGRPGKIDDGVVDAKIEERISAALGSFKKEINAKFDDLSARLEKANQITESNLHKSVYPTDCGNVTEESAKLRERGKGGVFVIYPKSRFHSVEVYCDLETDGGGWTVFQRRMDGSVDFYRDWTSYVNGFGYNDKEFWLGLETIHELTNVGEYELRVDLSDWEGNTFHAKYRSFSMSGSADNYTLALGRYSGNAGDSLSYHNYDQFSTYDQDHSCISVNCAETRKGAWWYCDCYNSNLNGIYHKGGKYKSSHDDGVVWYHLKSDYQYSLKFTEMKFRKKN